MVAPEGCALASQKVDGLRERVLGMPLATFLKVSFAFRVNALTVRAAVA